MKRLCGFLFLVGVVLLSASPVLATSPAATIPTATILKPGPIKNGDLPLNITIPGYYYLTENITYSGTTDGITVKSDNVTIDLGGFCLSGPGSSSTGSAITSLDITDVIPKGYKNVEVRNGSLNGWRKAFEGYDGNRALNLRVENCTHGILLRYGLVKDCTCDTGGLGAGISNLGLTTGCTITNCTTGITCAHGTVSGCFVSYCSNAGIEVSWGRVSGNFVMGCPVGIHCTGGGSIISNMVESGGTGGIDTSSANGPCLVTQNTVEGASTPYNLGGSTVSVNNAPPTL